MLVAQLHHDGIWDALSVKDGKLVYDWKKDKRFDILAKGDKANPEYGKQKGLYLTLVNDSNENYDSDLRRMDDWEFGTAEGILSVYECGQSECDQSECGINSRDQVEFI